MLFSSSFTSSFPETREEKFCLAASRATVSASSTVSLTFFFVFFFLFSFSRALRNAYPMTPEPQQKSMTRFVLSLQIPFFNLGEEDFSGSSSRIESKRNEVMMSSPPLAKNPGYVVHSFASTTLEELPPPPKNSFTFESTFLNDSREAFFSSPLERTLAVNANAKSFSLFLASSEFGECAMVACPGTRRGCSYKSCLYFLEGEEALIRTPVERKMSSSYKRREEVDVSAASNSNADDGYERGSLMDG